MKHVTHEVPPDRTPIEQFAIDYDVPQDLANRLIGRTETETQNYIDTFIEYLKSVIASYRERIAS